MSENGKVDNDVSLSPSFVRGSYDEAGRPVIIDRLETGEMASRRVESHKPYLRAVIRDAVQRRREALDILAAHDRGEAFPTSSAQADRA